MGMFDTLVARNGDDWQTKALGRGLRSFKLGDAIPGPPIDYQMEVIGEPRKNEFVWEFATIRAGVLHSLPEPRDESVLLLKYAGDWVEGKA